MKRIVLTILVLLAMPSHVDAQTRTERIADAASYVTSILPAVLDAKHSWDCADRVRCFELQGMRIGVGYSAVWLAKTVIHEDRPCAPDCGADRANASFFSGHTMLPFTALGGPSAAFVLTVGASTGGLRVMANKHWWWDTAVAAGVGSLVSRIR